MPMTAHKFIAMPAAAPAGPAPLTQDSLIARMRKLVKPEAMDRWLHAPNRKLPGLTPLEAVEGGDAQRLEGILYLLESGKPG
jgi:Protein of unknown function (DUF2384)